MPNISVYNKCNNNCLMCTNPDKFWHLKGGFDFAYLSKRIDRFYNGGKEFLENYPNSFSLSGGEPTLSVYLIPLIRKIAKLFPKRNIACLTNGRMFSYVAYAYKFFRLEANLELILPIHGHNADIHDKITKTPGSFFQTVKGIENIYRFKKSSDLIEIRVVIHRLNYMFLREITKFVQSEFPFINRLVFIFFEIEGQALKNFNKLKLTYVELFPYIRKLEDLILGFPEIRFYHFPLCALPMKFFPYVWRTLPEYEVSFLHSCNHCNLKELCAGIHKSYLSYVGASEFRPWKHNLNIVRDKNHHRPILRIDK